MKNLKIRLTAFALLGSMVLSGSLSGCAKKQNNNKEEVIDTKLVQLQDNNDRIEKGLIELFPQLSSEIIENSSLIIMLDELAKKDENGKISADAIANFKAKLNVDNMMSDFESLLNVLEQTIYQENFLITISNLTIEKDREILSKIEKITEEVINGKNVNNNFDLINTLIVKSDEITYDGLTFEISDLSYSGRAIASTYARVINNYSKGIVDEDKRATLDERTNNQNNKSQIKIDLEILANQMPEESKIDVINIFNKENEETQKILNNKVETENIKNLINYMNLEYLDSDKVSNKDKNTILGDYSELDVSNALTLVNNINVYNSNNLNSLILFSDMLVDEYKKEETGKIDKAALDYVQFNSLMFLKTTNVDMDKKELYNNIYFQNLYKYFTKQDFIQKYKNGETVYVCYQNMSDGSKFIANAIIYYTLNDRTTIYLLDGYQEIVTSNLEETIQYLQNTITGECEKVKIIEFVK